MLGASYADIGDETGQMLGVDRAARATIDHKAYDAVISNIGFVNSVLGDFTVDRQTTGWRSARCGIFCIVRSRVGSHE